MTFTEKVYSACKRIPKGKVATYSQIARAINKTKNTRASAPANAGLACRAVGNALNKNRSKSVPCHRVIRGDGGVGGFARGTRAKTILLEGEGVEITKNGKIPSRFIFTFRS